MPAGAPVSSSRRSCATTGSPRRRAPGWIFAPTPETAWEEALQSVGIDPGTLPSWTTANDEETAN
jgi:hypothetical protein